jgi:hypothetical protein
MSELNPLTEIIDHNGKRYRLDKLLKVEAQALAYEYLETHGARPNQSMVHNWMRRLKQAYHTGQVTSMVKEIK